MAAPQLDESVIRKAQRGDEDAFAEIVRAFQTPVFNFVYRLVENRDMAEEMTQEVFIRLLQNLPSFSFKARFSTWVFQIAKNRTVDELRARERRPRTTEISVVDGLLFSVDPPAEQADAIDVLWQAVGALSLDQKMALLLRDVAGFSYREIADIQHTTLETVKWRIFKARDDVQKALEHEGVVFAARRQKRPEAASAS